MAWYTWPGLSQPIASPWSQMNVFTTGLRSLSSWTAQWIQGGPYLQTAYAPSGVTCDNVLRVSMFVSGLGWYAAFINGQALTDTTNAGHLDVGWTRYDRRVYYSTVDVTDIVCVGASGPVNSTIEVALGGGHFASNWYDGTVFRGQLLLQLVRGWLVWVAGRWLLLLCAASRVRLLLWFPCACRCLRAEYVPVQRLCCAHGHGRWLAAVVCVV